MEITTPHGPMQMYVVGEYREVEPKTRLVYTEANVVVDWRRQLQRDRLPYGSDDWMFRNSSGRFLNPESLTQLFDRIVQRSELPRIRFHDLRHTHASLLVADGVAIKVVSE